VIPADEFVDDVRADEAGTARDEIAHAGILLRFLIVARREYFCGADSDAVAGVYAIGVRLNIA
jgi:hypothetical protein